MNPREWLEAYLDGELPAAEKSQVERSLREHPPLAQTLERLRGRRALRHAALQTYQPDVAESQQLAERWLEHCAADAPSIPMDAVQQKMPGSSLSPGFWAMRRGVGIAASLLLAAGCFWAGRASSQTQQKMLDVPRSGGYVVKISTPTGETVTQEYDTLAEAQKFANGYLQDQAVQNNSDTAVAALSPVGSF